MEPSIRGNGLFHIHDALARLEADPTIRDRALRRFDDDDGDSRQRRAVSDSGTSTEIESLADENADSSDKPETLREQRIARLRTLHSRSRPSTQFASQSGALALQLARLRYNEADEGGVPFPAEGTNERADCIWRWTDEARDKVRARWRAQGIWRESEWQSGEPYVADWWQHEPDPGAAVPSGVPATQEEVATSAAAPSRPIAQFLFQLVTERNYLLGLPRDSNLPSPKPHQPWGHRTMRGREYDEEVNTGADQKTLATPDLPSLTAAPRDVNSTAYTIVREAWKQREIWDPAWTVMPGIQWVHEEPLGDFIGRRLAEEMAEGEEVLDIDAGRNQTDEHPGTNDAKDDYDAAAEDDDATSQKNKPREPNAASAEPLHSRHQTTAADSDNSDGDDGDDGDEGAGRDSELHCHPTSPPVKPSPKRTRSDSDYESSSQKRHRST
ncbi:hypothetical protein SEUCBS139899_004254 [Sporothrix eucalyptigena]